MQTDNDILYSTESIIKQTIPEGLEMIPINNNDNNNNNLITNTMTIIDKNIGLKTP
jgi:hypothetical protein